MNIILTNIFNTGIIKILRGHSFNYFPRLKRKDVAMIFFLNFINNLLMFTLKFLRYVFTKNDTYTEKRKHTIETADVIFSLIWLILLPILNVDIILSYVRLLE